jgi:hypothetical protein
VTQASEAPSEPEPPGPWDPDQPTDDEEAGLAWLAVDVASNCEGSGAGERGELPALVTTESTFRQSFCMGSTIDWSRYRLAVYYGADVEAPRALRVTGARRETDRVRVFVSASGPCHAFDGYSGNYAAALLTASDQPVVFIRGESFMPDCPTPTDGYGY